MNHRQEKRLCRRMGQTPTYEAYTLGHHDADAGRPYRNPYPDHAKARRAEYDRGYRAADPMGDHHGRNK